MNKTLSEEINHYRLKEVKSRLKHVPCPSQPFFSVFLNQGSSLKYPILRPLQLLCQYISGFRSPPASRSDPSTVVQPSDIHRTSFEQTRTPSESSPRPHPYTNDTDCHGVSRHRYKPLHLHSQSPPI